MYYQNQCLHNVVHLLKQTLAKDEKNKCAASLHSSSAAVSVKDSNGTFVSTLSMILYNVSTWLCSAYYAQTFLIQFMDYEALC